MGKKLDKLQRVVRKLGDRYGHDDPDVLNLRQELQCLEQVREVVQPERRKTQLCRYRFSSEARQNFLATQRPELPL